MKRILILNPYFPTMGGGEKHMGYLCRFFEKKYPHVSIEVLVHDYNDIKITSPDYPTIDTLNQRFGLSLKRTVLKKIQIGDNLTPLGFLRYKKQIEKITRKYDLFVNFMIFSKHIGKAKRNVYTCMFPPQRFEHDGRFQGLWGYKNFSRWLDKRYINSYDVYISNSQFTNHWLHEYWKEEKDAKIIYPPVFSSSQITDRFNLSEKKEIILSVGRFFVNDHNKKQDTLVDYYVKNADKLKGTEFHLAGALSTKKEDIEYVEKIKKAAQGYPIFIHTNAPFDFLLDLYRKAKVFWHATGCDIDENLEPEKMEHFGITTVEAMSYGAVPVVINKGGQKEIVDNGINGFLWNTEAECIQQTKSILEDEKTFVTLAENAHEKSHTFSIEKFNEHNNSVFDAI